MWQCLSDHNKDNWAGIFSGDEIKLFYSREWVIHLLGSPTQNAWKLKCNPGWLKNVKTIWTFCNNVAPTKQEMWLTSAATRCIFLLRNNSNSRCAEGEKTLYVLFPDTMQTCAFRTSPHPQYFFLISALYNQDLHAFASQHTRCHTVTENWHNMFCRGVPSLQRQLPRFFPKNSTYRWCTSVWSRS